MMHVRALILGLSLLLTTLGGCGVSIRLPGDGTPTGLRQPLAASGRGEVVRQGDNRFRAACSNFEGVAVEQQSEVWCWAAAAEMVHRYHGRRISQREIAERIQGHSGNSPEKAQAAGVAEMTLALSPEMHDRLVEQAYGLASSASLQRMLHGGFQWQQLAEQALNFSVSALGYDSEQMVADISGGMPMVAGLVEEAGESAMGHIYVIYALTYSEENPPLTRQLMGEAKPTYSLHSAEAIDPWTGKPVTLSGKRLTEQLDFVLTQRRSEELLGQVNRSLGLH